jgi:hypothetical protein
MHKGICEGALIIVFITEINYLTRMIYITINYIKYSFIVIIQFYIKEKMYLN